MSNPENEHSGITSDLGQEPWKVSVIVPVYNVKPFLEEALDSLVGQSYENLEILLIDDGSDDGSGELCDLYVQKDRRIRVVHQSNQGLSAARNAGLDLFTGQAVAFLDPDDAFHPDMIRRMLEILIREKADMVVCGHRDYRTLGTMDAKKLKLRKKRPSKNRILRYTRKEAFASLIVWKLDALVWSKISRREVWKELRFPVGHVYEDLYIIFDLLAQTECVCLLPDELVMYRIRPGSIMNSLTLEHIRDYLRAWSHSEEFVAKNIPAFFSRKQLILFRQQLLRQLLLFYLDNYRSNGPDKTAIDAFLNASISDLWGRLDIGNCKYRFRIAHWLYLRCPFLLAILYPIYHVIHVDWQRSKKRWGKP